MGAPAKPVRMALGALIIIKERCGYSDEKTVAQIRENPYAADIRYPTDDSLLNEAHEKLEAMIDVLL